MRAAFCLAILFLSPQALPDALGQITDAKSLPLSSTLMAGLNAAAHTGCAPRDEARAITLPEVVELALCNEPKTRKAWADIAAKRAVRGELKADYLPTFTATAQTGFSGSSTGVDGASFYDSNIATKGAIFSGDLNWTFFNFGLTRSRVKSATFALSEAIANKDSAVQSVALEASRAYYDVLDAEAAVEADKETENYAHQSASSAKVRYKAGIAALTDDLQATTAYSFAQIKRIAAEGALRVALGALCVAIGEGADNRIVVDRSDDSPPSSAFIVSIRQLMADAKLHNPDLVSARAAESAAYADYETAKAYGMPTLSLVGSLNKNLQRSDSSQNITSILSTPPDNVSRERQVALQLTVPLFAGVSRRYKVKQALATAEEAAITAEDAERQLSLTIWKAYQDLRTEADSYDAIGNLIKQATASYGAAKGRYIAGVGTIIDVLSAQSEIASATDQRISALSSWRFSKLTLAATLGELGGR
jgi:outer membrane protein